MKIAVMQPYFYPYIGYFELISKVDIFVFLVDAQFKKRSWMTRNYLRGNLRLTIPTQKVHQKDKINQILIDNNQNWKELHLKKLLHLYGKNSLSHPIFQVYNKEYSFLCDFLCESIIETSKFFGLKTIFKYSTEASSDKSSVEKIVDICNFYKCDEYYNLPSGRSLYKEEDFGDMRLNFMSLTDHDNKLSIIDVCLYEKIDHLYFKA